MFTVYIHTTDYLDYFVQLCIDTGYTRDRY